MPGERIVDGNLTPVGHQQLTSVGSATALTVPAGARVAIIQAETKDCRWRDDGTNPTSGVGIILSATGSPLFYTGTLSAFKIIETAASAKVNVAYYT